jgi:hypothetical protein
MGELMPPIPDGRRHVIPISGKDSLAAALVQREREPWRRYEYLFCDVGMELPETYAWLAKVEVELGVALHRVGKSLEDVITEQGILPSPRRRICTKYAKIFPMREWLGDDDAVQYVGIRADEDARVEGFVSTDNIEIKFPLRDAGMGVDAVYNLLDARGLGPPSFFWKRLYDDVWTTLSDASKRYVAGLRPWQAARLFSWRSRSNCYMCFYQRLYEWVGLLEHHPDLYAAAERLERTHGNGPRRAEPYTLRPDGPLSALRSRADEVFSARVQQVRRAVVAMRTDPDQDMLAQVSCGVYCGK